MATSHLSTAEAAGIRGEFRKLAATIGELNDWPTITIEDRDGPTGILACIKIGLEARQPENAGAGTPATGTTLTGTIRAWADDFSRAIGQGNRFIWQDQRCSVVASGEEKNGVIQIPFAVDSGNRGGA